MIARTRIARVAASALLAGLAGVMGACESDAFTETTSTAPLGAGSGSPTYLSSPSRLSAQPEPEDLGMGSGSPTKIEEPAQPAPQPRRAGDCNYSPQVGPGMSVASMAFPTGDPGSSALMLYQVMPSEVRKGAEFNYEYHVTNLTRGTLQNVAVMLESRSNLEVLDAGPSAQSGQDGTVWSIGELGPCETRVIEIMARADEAGQAANCVSVSYNNALCAVTTVVNPELAVTKNLRAPRDQQTALLCEPFTLTYEVCNTGTGSVTGVVLRDTLPEGITTADGGRNVEREIGTLAAGECRQVEVPVNASRTGEFCSLATVESSDGLTATSNEVCATVIAPALEIACETRDTQYINRTTTYEFTVTNTGEGPSDNTVVNVSLPSGVEFLQASTGGTQSSGGTSFALGTLAAGESRTVSVDLVGRQPGTVRVSATANGNCAEAASTSCETEYRGIPAILLEVVDLVDPVEVGETTTYRITVTNQGTAEDRDVRIVCVIPPEQEFVSATGPTSRTGTGNEINFGALPSLAAGAQATWEVTVRAIGEADVRFAVQLTSERFTTPVRETESTNLYE